MEEIPKIQIGDWVILSEDGIWFSGYSYNDCSYKTKKEALWDISTSCLDARRTPKVRRLYEGHYEYTVKDCDTNRFGESYSIVRVTANNVERYNELFKDQWNNDPSYIDEDEDII